MPSLPGAAETLAPHVSVVLITFDHERWVREALDSILGQEHPADRLQVIVVDNGSTDATPSILQEYADRVELILLDGIPLNDAVDLGQSKVRGEFFTGLSGDDAWTPGRLAEMLDVFARRPRVGLVYGDMEVIGPDSETLHPSWRAAHGLPVHEGRLFGRQLERNLVFGPAVLMRSALRPALLPIPAHAAWEDWWFSTTAARITEVAYLPFPVTRYRRHSAALSNVTTPERQIAFLREDLRFRAYLLQTLAVGDATPEELTTAVLAQIDGVLRLAELMHRTPASAMGIGGADRRHAQAARRRAQACEDPAGRMTWFARGIGHDPTDARAAQQFSRAAGEAETAGAGADLRPLDPRTLLADAHDHVTLALGEEILASPGLVADHLASLGADATETLAVHAGAADPAAVTACLEAALGSAGSDADVVLLDLPDEPAVRAALAVRATDLLTRGGATGWPWAGIPARPPVPRAAVPAL